MTEANWGNPAEDQRAAAGESGSGGAEVAAAARPAPGGHPAQPVIEERAAAFERGAAGLSGQFAGEGPEAPGESRALVEAADPAGDERGIDELIEIAEEIPDQLGLSEGLAAIRATASGEGLSVTVNLHGMLVHLDIGESALELGPAALAAEISRLSTEAGSLALQQGLRAVRAGCVPAVAAAVEDELALDDVPEAPQPAQEAPREPEPARVSRRRAPVDDQDDEGFVLTPVKD
ncbi:hypothetical protein [Amycolatopsis echigonensis]|uniref:YbaB/EbfC DNA-binding family protein n=1 Tax=Amycolatopsis echigonensis TaxID=2576905 RepID=A0A2N3WPC1_9PSEU|nr:MULTISPECIES: hypothetical protein [Amycolatopsis]PKV95710.1 hypothetical protein ATK30_6638 [Amycolatopsis niigatensis]